MLQMLMGVPRRALSVTGLLAAGALLAAVPDDCSAQDTQVRVIRPPLSDLVRTPLADRAMLGIVMAPGSRADTAGVHIEEVEPNGPAAKAGLKAGDILTEINGTSLRVSREDADDLALAGLAQRRLQRVLAKAKPGDEVTLSVRSGGSARKVTLKTTSAAALERDDDRRVVERTIVRDRDGVRTIERDGDRDRDRDRGMVGMTVGGAGNPRDTLGLFVSSVVTGGPAEKAGIVEGERIAAVNGIDVRVAREDVDDAEALSARVNRFVREVQKAEPGKTVTLRVYGGGRYRDVAVTAARASDLPRSGFSISVGDGGMQILTPRAPRPPMPPSAGEIRPPEPPRVFEFDRDGDIGRLRLDGREMRIDLQRLRESIEELQRGIQRGVERGLDGGLRSFEWRDAPVRSRRAVVIL